MVNVRTLKGLQAALHDCVPGRAQRGRLLEALARVPGNRTISAAMSALKAREDEMGPPRRERPEAAPKSGTRFRAQVISYTQAAPEVQVTMSKETARVLLSALEAVYSQSHSPDTPTGQLHRALCSALEGSRARG